MSAHRLCLTGVVVLALGACTRAQPRPQAEAPPVPQPPPAPAPQQSGPPLKGQPRWSVEGRRNTFQSGWGSRLVAEDGERRQVLIDQHDNLPPGPDGQRDDLRVFDWLGLLRVGDFDRDGRDDALVEAFGDGNCCVPCYLFASVPSSGEPLVTNSFCTGEGAPVVEETTGQTTFTITDGQGSKTYVLTGNEARLQSRWPHLPLETLFEFTAEQLWKLAATRGTLPDETMERLAYDLDRDGRAERIECKGAERWNAMSCKIYLGDLQVGDLGACKRIGVLRSMTRGMYDLACEGRLASQWNGSTYP